MNNKSYKVTLSIPVYNVEKYIERALISAFNQSFDSIEFLIVDDKGSDNSMQIVQKVLSEHPRGKDARIIDHVVNRSLGAVRNTSIEEAKGEYLYFMDSDDEITPDCIEKLYNKIKALGVDFVSSSCIRKNLKGEEWLENEPYKEQTIIKDNDEFIIDSYYCDDVKINGTATNKLYNLSFLRRNNIKCFSNHLTEDISFSFQILQKAKSCALIPDVTYIYYVTPNAITDDISRSKEKSERIAKECIEILEYKTNIINQYKGKKWFDKAIKCLIVDSYYYINDVLKSKIENKDYYVNRLIGIPFKIYKPSILNKMFIPWIISISPYCVKQVYISAFFKKYGKA